MDDNRTRGWLLARLVLATAIVTVIAIPLLASSGPGFGMSRWESLAYDQPITDTRARGWLVARLELAIAVIAVLVATIIVVTYQPFLLSDVGGGRWAVAYRVWAAAFPYVGEALAIIGLVWMIRIWRGPTRDAPPEWRYRP